MGRDSDLPLDFQFEMRFEPLKSWVRRKTKPVCLEGLSRLRPLPTVRFLNKAPL